jgi:hypothetical protein
MRQVVTLAALLAVLGTAAGCGSDDDSRPRPTATATIAATATAPPTASATAPPPTAAAPHTATATAPPVDTATAPPSPTPTQPADTIRIIEPAPGAVVTTFTLTIRVAIDPSFGPADVTAQLGSTTFSLLPTGVAGEYGNDVGPGNGQRDDNTLIVTATRNDGAELTRSISFRYLPPKAVARRITDPADLVRGPLADGQVGDYLLANTVARFIIQDAGKRDIYSVGAFGGNIIDAELLARPGRDNFLEIQPAVNVETVINAQLVEILNDGQDGRPAVIRTCGPDDVLDFVNPSTIIEDIGQIPFPAAADDVNYDVTGCTEYTLEPGQAYVRMETTITNNADVEIGLFVGDFINAAGEVEQWTNSGIGIGEILTSNLAVLSFIGYGEATGVDYFLIPLSRFDPMASDSSFFTAAGVSYVMHGNSVIGVILGGTPTFVVPPGGSNRYARLFGVGDGSGGNAVSLELQVKGLPVGVVRGCVTVGGAPAVAARVTIGPTRDGAITGVSSTFVTDAQGCYAGGLSPGDYGIAAARHGVPYEGGGTTPIVHPITVEAGSTTVQDVALPATGRVRVAVVDDAGAPVPARIGVVGFDPSPDIRIPAADVTGLFYDPKEALSFGLVHVSYTDAEGRAELEVEPGSYQLFASRGVEYSLFEQPITVSAGAPVEVSARIARVVDTTGFISSDYHVHGIASADSRVPDSDRVRQYAGEGVDNIIMTDHHAHTDLTPKITELAFTPFLRATVGEEITTWDYGHFNAYPLTIDPTRPSGGSTDWAGAAPPGEDFKSLGAYCLTPAELQELALTSDTSTPDTMIQINHIDSFFDPLQIDTAAVPPQSFISATDKLRFRLDPESGNLFAHFRALEVWNGSSRGKQSEFLDLRLGIWFNHLNQGLLTTAIGDTDTHEFLPLGAAGARTWTASPTDDPPQIDPSDAARAIADGRAVAGQGVYVQTRLHAGDSSGAVADLTRGGSTLVRSTNRSVSLEIDAQAPLWAPFDRVEIYANAPTIVARERKGTPTLYTSEPTLVLVAGKDFTPTRQVVVSSVPGAERWRANLVVPFSNLATDTWFVVIVKGTDGVSRPMFPVFTDDLARGANQTLADLIDGNLGEGGVLALGVTNALYADVDGEPGFQAPLAP